VIELACRSDRSIVANPAYNATIMSLAATYGRFVAKSAVLRTPIAVRGILMPSKILIPQRSYNAFKAAVNLPAYIRCANKRAACMSDNTPLPIFLQTRTQSSLVAAAACAIDTDAEKPLVKSIDQWRMSPEDDGYQLVLNRNPNQLKRVLLISTSINSLTNAVYMHLQENCKYELKVAAIDSGRDIEKVVEKVQPDLIICPYLTKKIPAEVYKKYICWIVHPGIVGDRGAYSIDYALLTFEDWKPESERWGVTVLQAHEEYDAGAIWSTKEFPLSNAVTKSELYHTSVTRAAIDAIDNALESFKNPEAMPISLKNYSNARGNEQTSLKQKQRGFSWDHDSAKTIAQKINAASGQPGIKTNIFRRRVLLLQCLR
jgi:folate-dependent phosphoribosylglycinamide formyltransferase PurN